MAFHGGPCKTWTTAQLNEMFLRKGFGRQAGRGRRELHIKSCIR
jgi:hypothetical protein